MNKEELKIFIKNHRCNYGIELKRQFKDLFDIINNSYNYNTFGEKVFCYLYGDYMGKCEICGNKCVFENINDGYRKRCSYKCHGINRSIKSREKRQCVICGKEFEIYKKREKSTCSMECLLKLTTSPEVNLKRYNSTKRALLEKYGVSHPSYIKGVSKKAKETKLKRYGNENYNNFEQIKKTKKLKYGNEKYINTEKYKETMLKKYGVINGFHLKHAISNGKRISNFQRKIYDDILTKYPDAKLEEYLENIDKSVDIYIPSINKIIECYGDYWHCNPKKYASDFYNRSIHLTAQEIWNRDKFREEFIINHGYQLEVIWENHKIS